MMFHHSHSRNARNRSSRIKRTLQTTLIICVAIWLLYQMKHSYDKKKQYALNGEIIGEGSGEGAFYGRKERAGGSSFEREPEVTNVVLSSDSNQRQDEENRNDSNDSNNNVDEGVEVNFDLNQDRNAGGENANDGKQEGEIEKVFGQFDNGEHSGDRENNFPVNQENVESDENKGTDGEVNSSSSNGEDRKLEVQTDEIRNLEVSLQQDSNPFIQNENGNEGGSDGENDKHQVHTDENMPVVQNGENNMNGNGEGSNGENDKSEGQTDEISIRDVQSEEIHQNVNGEDHMTEGQTGENLSGDNSGENNQNGNGDTSNGDNEKHEVQPVEISTRDVQNEEIHENWNGDDHKTEAQTGDNLSGEISEENNQNGNGDAMIGENEKHEVQPVENKADENNLVEVQKDGSTVESENWSHEDKAAETETGGTQINENINIETKVEEGTGSGEGTNPNPETTENRNTEMQNEGGGEVNSANQNSNGLDLNESESNKSAEIKNDGNSDIAVGEMKTEDGGVSQPGTASE